MAINRISGNILQDNLNRGANLAFETNLLYIDITNDRVGINTSSTTHTLTVNGNTNISGNFSAGNVNTAGGVSATGNVEGNVAVFNDLFVGNVDIGNLISGGNLQVDSVTANLYLSAVGNVTGGNIVTGGIIDAGNISASGNVVGGNINTTGVVSTTGNVEAGNVNTTLVAATDVTATGNVTGGNVLTGGIVSATGNVTGGNITTPGDVSATGNIYAANFVGGNVSLGNLYISNTTISANVTDGNITLQPDGTALVYIDTVTGLVVPVGNTAQRPTGVTGTVRFNTDSARLEVYDGGSWEDIAANVTNQVITTGDGSTVQFTLDRSATAASILVSINGVVQVPGVSYSYTVTGNQITFADAPISSDIIDIRFL